MPRILQKKSMSGKLSKLHFFLYMKFGMLVYIQSSDISSVIHEFSKIAGFYPVRTPESCLNILRSNLYSFPGTQD